MQFGDDVALVRGGDGPRRRTTLDALAARRRDDDPLLVQLRGGTRRDPGAAQELLGQADPAAVADDDLLVVPGLPRGLRADAAVADVDDAVGDRRRLGVVRDDHRRRTRVAREVADRVVDALRVHGVELARRLVGDEEPRPVRQRRAERDALLLSPRQLVGTRVALVREVDALQ